jgi:hypothetical protein
MKLICIAATVALITSAISTVSMGAMLTAFGPQRLTVGIWAVSSLLGLVSVFYASSYLMRSAHDKPSESIWDQQRRIMQVSGQVCPTEPTITPTTLMYNALVIEETGESCATLSAVLRQGAEHLEFPYVALLAEHLREDSQLLMRIAKDRREIISHLPQALRIRMTHEQAALLLDDTTDIMVVGSGFGLAAGLPSEAGWEEVNRSNMSKVNPLTGEIDKDRSGKWVKGVNYTPPDLSKLLKGGSGQYE